MKVGKASGFTGSLKVGLKERDQERLQGFELKQLEPNAIHKNRDDCG